MTGLIWEKTSQRAVEKLEEVIEDYAKANIKPKVRTFSSVTFLNGDSWQAIAINEYMKAKPANLHYINHSIDPDFISDVIKDKINHYPFYCFKYYGGWAEH